MINSLSSLVVQRKPGIILVFLLLAVILALQITLLIEEINPKLVPANSPILGYFTYIYATLTYLVFSVLMRLESNNLEDFHIDRFAVATFVVGSILRRRIGIPWESFFLIMIGLAGIFMIFTLIQKKPAIPKTKIRWVLAGVGISGITLILIILFELFFRNTWAVILLSRNHAVATVISEILKEFSFGALIEEILFRAFLWGYLKRAGWNENKIFWTQGMLFWFLHLSRIVTPFTFFIVIPLITVIFSKLTLRSRQIYPAIVAHIVVNVISTMLNLATY
jgi:membrane protease YdiL (CAAX protease family)